ncbi:sensor histidine kinase [Mycobacterium spongiae]|uniref:histidine kinase n=1 Tax=Mycobacterium spongiae TaxID=886343 RepID=A0A975PW34_9MYCO|nr:ATP-binding protein [Mycobacterium spongiae]QUR66776.1 HAMP domain-containing protein [Mycobacterium spongiae]
MTESDDSPSRGRRRSGFGVRLLLAQIMVMVVGTSAAAIVAAVAGPPLFREHLRRAGVTAGSHQQHLVEEAYEYGAFISAVAVAVALVTALVVSWYLSRRLGRSVTDLASAAAAVATGRYDHRVETPHLGDDFAALATAFNQMATKLESVEQTRRRLFSDLAHEIRTPVSVLEAYTEALQDGVRTLNAESIAVLHDQSQRLVRLSADFAALSQAEENPGSVTPTWVAPKDLVGAALAAAESRFADKGVALRADVGDDLPPMWADPHRIGQVLANLLDNALRYTPTGGSVDVAAHVHHRELTLTVTDSGEGVPADQLAHLFERFYRVDTARDRQHGGAGIGLAIAKALVEAHGGHIAASSRGIGTGTTFTFSVPLA